MRPALSSLLLVPFLSIFYQAVVSEMSGCPGSQTLASAKDRKRWVSSLSVETTVQLAWWNSSELPINPAADSYLWASLCIFIARYTSSSGSRSTPLGPGYQDLFLWCHGHYHCNWGTWVWKIVKPLWFHSIKCFEHLSCVLSLVPWGLGRRDVCMSMYLQKEKEDKWELAER
jgi:hypothetical protein